MMMGRILMVVLLTTGAATVQAGFTAAGTDARQILVEQRQIRKEIESATGKYSRFNEQAQGKLRTAQEKIFGLLAGGRTLEQLSRDEQVDLLNSVEEVKAILSDNHQDKLECWRERKVGTSLKVTRCETVAVRERLREEARQWKSDVGACQMGEGGGPECGPPDIAPSSRGY